jgi:hypothetical protein
VQGEKENKVMTNDDVVQVGSVFERQTRVSLTIRVVPKIMSEDASPATQAEQEELQRIEKHW